MKPTRLASILLAATLGACGGGGGDGDGGNSGGPDAGPDAMATALGHDALGAYHGAEMLAKWEQPDETLYRITGDYLSMSGRETDPSQFYSFWTFSFISPGTGVTVDVTYSNGMYGEPYISSSNPEGKRLIPDGWFGSIEAIDYIVQVGFVEPAPGDPDYRMAMTLEMAPDTTIVDPIWRITKTYVHPPDPSMGEQWLCLYSTPDDGVVVCDPSGACFLVP
jgi:hypothetical protein